MAQKFGRKVDDNVLKSINVDVKPLEQHLIFYMMAYKDLDRQRSHGFAPTRIPFIDIVTYARLYNLNIDEEDDLIYFVTNLDDHHIKQLSDDLEKKTKQSKKGSK